MTDTTTITESVVNVDPETITNLIDFILNMPFIGPYLPYVLAVVTIASAIAAVTPTPKKGSWWYVAYTVIVDLPALNIFKAKDKGDS